MHFLLADDSDAKRTILEIAIRQADLNADVIIAKTTEEANALIDTYDDIVCAFIDYEMPSANGPAVIAYLKKKNPAAHIALVTSADSKKYEQDARDAGAEKFICTSRQEEEVKAALTDVLTEWKTLLS